MEYKSNRNVVYSCGERQAEVLELEIMPGHVHLLVVPAAPRNAGVALGSKTLP